ncbi:adenylate kinase [Olsenella sp. An285]|uniref:adenylate kinase n=1 Tax=Olsenella sp. An285 TaxID=1965621 RepID=UPI0019D2CF35|nr:adenylate kinase [Olsenella sp. An285]
MRRVAIIGSPGSGKSTLARGLRNLTGLPLHYLDMLWHLPDGGHVTRAAFDAAHEELVSQERWIIDGTYLRTLPSRLERADAVVLLDLPLETCLEGIRARIGKAREDLPWQETKLDPEFVSYVRRFPDEQLPRIRELLDARPSGCRLVELRSREEAEHALVPGGLLWKLVNPVSQLDT